MNELAIITYSDKAANLYRQNLERLLEGRIRVSGYSVESHGIRDRISADLVMISAFDLYELVRRYVPDSTQIMIPNLTILKTNFQALKDLPTGTKALYVNANFDMAIQGVEQIYQLGARHIELVPYSPYLEHNGEIKVAITPGETQHVPTWIDTVIDIGNRVMDVGTIVNILLYFNIEELFNAEGMRKYCRSIMPQNYNPRFQDKLNPFSMSDLLMDNDKRGVVGVSSGGIILNYNGVAERTLGIPRSRAIGENVLSLFPEPAIRDAIKDLKPAQKKQIRVNGKDLLVDIKIGKLSSTTICYLIFEHLREPAASLPYYGNQAIGRGYTAKYRFEDIVTEDEGLRKLKRVAEINAQSDSSVLILGESGTGKELFAQAIHNASGRKDRPFVAINCAAIAESLLESELFGYDEGAFTGARRGGKKGVFELAHSGTLFLDEIGEMQTHLQARLLRVLQEREVTRLGGDRVIGVDVRVIAATNRDISELIKAGEFRKDLYYRLNVITLTLPSLAERRGDIALLIAEFKRRLGAEYELPPSIMEELQNHAWEGNIRELRNCVEYLTNLRKPIIGPEDLPFSRMRPARVPASADCAASPGEAAMAQKARISAEDGWVLKTLDEARLSGAAIGRRSIAERSGTAFHRLPETRIRGILAKLEALGLVEATKGRGGTRITEEGAALLGSG